jgi:ABC-type multidrug transport system ATPase subunit
MLDFILGAAIIALPPQHQIPLAIGTAVVKGIKGLHRKKRERIASSLTTATDEVELSWSELSCTLKEKDGKERILLDKLHGTASPGRLLAICGPSGSGKTTLLNALAGQLPFNKKMHLEGYITANGQQIPVPGIRSGFVAQEDLFFSQMTVKETLMMAAEMRSASVSTPEAREATVDTVIRRLGLGKCADTPVGDAKTRGLSGGEKKRLSIACELVSKPQLILADEPTSGLDAFAAQQAMQALKDLTDDGHTVIASIHQPRSSIFAMFDDLCLLSDGQLIYFGPAQEALTHFEKLGHTCPQHYNPAEFLADLVAIDHSSEEKENESRERVTSLAAAWKEKAHSTSSNNNLQEGEEEKQHSGATPAGDIRPGCSLQRQVALLLKRSWRQVTRDKATLASRASSQISSAAVFSGIYWRMGRGQPAIQDRLGLLQVSAVGVAMTAMIKTLNVFPQERTIVTRERARAAYPVFPYLVAKLAAELPIGAVFPAMFGAILYPSAGLNAKLSRFGKYLAILTAESFSAQALGLAVGAAAPSTSAALAIGPAVMLVFIVFGGLFVNAEGLPAALKWVPRTSLIKQSFEGACINEFQGEEYEADSKGRGDVTGEQVLARLAFTHDKVESTLINQGRITVFYWWATYCILQAKRPKYLPLLPPRKK